MLVLASPIYYHNISGQLKCVVDRFYAALYTERELEVLRELTTNRSNEEIAEKYNISLNTVKRHIQNMLNKTGYKNRLELAINAKSLGLVGHDDDRKATHRI